MRPADPIPFATLRQLQRELHERDAVIVARTIARLERMQQRVTQKAVQRATKMTIHQTRRAWFTVFPKAPRE